MRTPPIDLVAAMRPSARQLPVSGIIQVFNYGRSCDGLMPLWAGEGGAPTPPVIYEAAIKPLQDGQTLYTHQLGIPELREALAGYFQGLNDRPFKSDEFYIVGGGMQSRHLSMQMTVGQGDEVIILSPGWPNFEGAAVTQGAIAKFVKLDFGPLGWILDLDRLFAACGPKTRAICIKSDRMDR